MIRLGLYGCGDRTRALLDALYQDKFYNVQAVFDLSSEKAQSLTAAYGGRICSSAEELIAAKDVDAFLISLSPLAHAAALRQTIPAGKPIFVEKPVSFSGKELMELALLAEKHHVMVQVGFMRRYLQETRAALDFIKQNDPGRLFCVDCTWTHQGDTEMNYYMQHFPDNFRLKVSQIPFHCCHMLDIMILLGGPVKRVNAQLIKVTERPYISPDDLIANMEFANGANGRFHYSSMVYGGEMSYRFNAENYSLNLGVNGPFSVGRRPQFRTSQVGPHPEQVTDWDAFIAPYHRAAYPEKRTFPSCNSVTEQIMWHFVQMVRDGVPPEANLRHAVRVQSLAEAMEISGKERRTIEFDKDGLPIL